MKESFALLFQGRDENGQALAGGYRGVVIGVAGDLEFFQSWLGFPGSTANFPCALCPVDKDNLLDWRDSATWRQARYCNGRAWRAAAGGNTCCLFHGDIALSCLNLLPDVMHTKYLGTDQYAYASILHILVYRLMLLSCSMGWYISEE